MSEHLRIRSACYEILILGDNIASVGVWNGVPKPMLAKIRTLEDERTLVLDTRVLLGVSAADLQSPGASVDWQSTDGTRRARLIVDAVEQIVDCPADSLVGLPRVPIAARGLFDAAAYDADLGRFRLRLRPDVVLPFSTFEERRRWRRSVVCNPETALTG